MFYLMGELDLEVQLLNLDLGVRQECYRSTARVALEYYRSLAEVQQEYHRRVTGV